MACKRCSTPCLAPLCGACLPTVTAMAAWGDGEYWLPVSSDGTYRISSCGRIASKRFEGRMLKPVPNQKGYQRVRLSGRDRWHSVNHLVLESFVGPRPPGMQGCHGDDVKANNALPNLRWDTQSENMREYHRTGDGGCWP